MGTVFSLLGKSALVVFTVVIAAGGAIWLATKRSEDYYLREAFRNHAAMSLWIRPSRQQQPDSRDGLSQVSLSAWLNPKRTAEAFSHFDRWIQEYHLLQEETDEAAGNDAHVLPPFPLPQDEEDDASSFPYSDVDPYDDALSAFLGDLWSSGFVTLLGSAHLNVPWWAKPLSGLSVALAHSRFSSTVLDALMDGLPLRTDGGDLPSWVSSIPFAQVDNDSEQGVIHELVVDLGGRDLAELFGRLCELENLSERYCTDEGTVENPLQPLFIASEKFKVQLVVFWSLRGEHFIWSNQKQCLTTMISGPQKSAQACSGDLLHVGSKRLAESNQLFSFKGSLLGQENQGAGMWFNQTELNTSIEKVLRLLEHQKIEGASWMQDYFLSAAGERSKFVLLGMFRDWQHNWPVWGAEMGYADSQLGRLLTYARSPVRPGVTDALNPPAALLQFEFLNGMMGAWVGLPRATVRLARSTPWHQVKDFWQAESVYRMGWSEQQ